MHRMHRVLHVFAWWKTHCQHHLTCNRQSCNEASLDILIRTRGDCYSSQGGESGRGRRREAPCEMPDEIRLWIVIRLIDCGAVSSTGRNFQSCCEISGFTASQGRMLVETSAESELRCWHGHKQPGAANDRPAECVTYECLLLFMWNNLTGSLNFQNANSEFKTVIAGIIFKTVLVIGPLMI